MLDFGDSLEPQKILSTTAVTTFNSGKLITQLTQAIDGVLQSLD
jgi:hypothetical protein